MGPSRGSVWKDSVAPLEASLTLWGVLERGLP